MPSYEKRGKKQLWSVRFDIMEDGLLKTKRLSGFKTKAEAQNAWRLYKPVEKPKKVTEKEKITFSRVCDAYLDTQKSRIKNSSFTDCISRLKKIRPFFDNFDIKEIKPIDILNWQGTLKEYAPKYIASLRRQLSAVLTFAERYYDVPSVMRKVEPFRTPTQVKTLHFWTEEQFAQFMAAFPAEKPAQKLFFRFLYIMGCRKGEALALQWQDINEEERSIAIFKSVTQKGENGREITSTKNTASERVLDLPSKLFADLMEAKRERKSKKEHFIFGEKTPFSASYLDRIWREVTQRAGLPKIRIHDLRHSCASLLISKGISIVAVSKRLGHTDTEQTLNTYAHLMPRDSERILKELANL